MAGTNHRRPFVLHQRAHTHCPSSRRPRPVVLRLSHEVNLRQRSTDDCGAFRSLGPCSLPSSAPPGLGMTRLFCG